MDAILLLPDSAFPNWEWKLEDRRSWYDEIKSNNYYTDNNPDFFTLAYFESNSAKFILMDGTWSVSLYKNSDNSSIIITDDLVADDNYINIYEINSNKITSTTDIKTMFGDYRELIKQKESNPDCIKKYEEKDYPIFTFDFSNPVAVEIESSWYLTKDEYSDCLEGNSLIYNFNPDTKHFDLEKIYWKNKTSNQ